MLTDSEKLQQVLSEYFETEGIKTDEFNDILESLKKSRIFWITPDDISLMAQKIKERREKLKLSQSDIAKVIGTTDATIRAHEKNGYLSLAIEQGIKIFRFLNDKEGKHRNASIEL